MRGRKPKPTAKKRLEGNPGKRKLNKAEPLFAADDSKPPRVLNAAGQDEWKRLAPILRLQRLLTEADYALFAAYCDAFGRWHEANEKLRASSLILKTVDGNLIQNPYVANVNRAIEQMVKIAAEFGLTPSSRTRISVPQVPEADQLEMELFGPTAQITK